MERSEVKSLRAHQFKHSVWLNPITGNNFALVALFEFSGLYFAVFRFVRKSWFNVTNDTESKIEKIQNLNSNTQQANGFHG